MLKKIGIGILGFIALLLLLPLVLPTTFEVQRVITIDTEVEAIFPYVNKLPNWDKWSPWTQNEDPDMQFFYPGKVQGLGAKRTWISPKMGNGEMVFTEVNTWSTIKYDIKLNNSWTSKGVFRFYTKDNKSQVHWRFYGELSYFYRYFGLFIDSMVGPEFERGLVQLKELVEKENKPKVYPVKDEGQKVDLEDLDEALSN